MSKGEKEMEPIKEEDTPPNSASSLKSESKSRFSSEDLQRLQNLGRDKPTETQV